MEFIQSRFQHIFSRVYELTCELVFYLIISLILTYAFSAEFDITIPIIVYSLFTVLSVAYFGYFYKGHSMAIKINDEQFVLVEYKTVTEINWQDYEGYKISKTMPYRIVIKNRVYGTTPFSYYAFSPSQRKKIIEVLENKNN